MIFSDKYWSFIEIIQFRLWLISGVQTYGEIEIYKMKIWNMDILKLWVLEMRGDSEAMRPQDQKKWPK